MFTFCAVRRDCAVVTDVVEAMRHVAEINRTSADQLKKKSLK